MNWHYDAAKGHSWHAPYHGSEYGFPADDESALFERLALEVNQAGLSWVPVLKKSESFNRAFAGFEVDRVAEFGEPDRARLLADAGIIRNHPRVDAVIAKARVVRAMRDSHTGLGPGSTRTTRCKRPSG